MHRVVLDTESADVKKFLSALPIDPEGVTLELEGRVIGKIIPPDQLSEAERDAVLRDGLKLMRQSQERNKGVPAKVIEREVREAVDEVRRQARR